MTILGKYKVFSYFKKGGGPHVLTSMHSPTHPLVSASLISLLVFEGKSGKSTKYGQKNHLSLAPSLALEHSELPAGAFSAAGGLLTTVN
jgi:hypothetical protein